MGLFSRKRVRAERAPLVQAEVRVFDLDVVLVMHSGEEKQASLRGGVTGMYDDAPDAPFRAEPPEVLAAVFARRTRDAGFVITEGRTGLSGEIVTVDRIRSYRWTAVPRIATVRTTPARAEATRRHQAEQGA